MNHQPARVRLADDVVLQTIQGEALLLKLGDESVFALNDTAAHIAERLAAGERVADVIASLTLEYGQSQADVELDVRALLDTLLGKGLVVADR
jgi:hypothetical protein